MYYVLLVCGEVIPTCHQHCEYVYEIFHVVVWDGCCWLISGRDIMLLSSKGYISINIISVILAHMHIICT